MNSPTGQATNKSKMADGRHFSKKPVKSPYLCNRVTDFDEIWHNDAYWPPTAEMSLKFKMAAAAMLKITKIAIYPQQFDRSLRNSVRLCKMGLLTAPTVKNFEFHKSKMADGRHFKNRYVIKSQQPFE